MKKSKKSPLQIIKDAYAAALTFEDDDALVVDVFISILTAQFCVRLDEPVWFYLIAPAGSGKTLTVETVVGYDRCLLLTTPTENAFMSGYTDDDGNDPSLLSILNNKTLIWKDFTALLNGPPNVVRKIFGEMRDSFDQHSAKASGMNGVREYNCRYGQIACVTNKIDSFTNQNQQLGERFLSFRMNRVRHPHKRRVRNLLPIIKSMKNKREWKETLKVTVQKQLEVINERALKKPIPEIPAGALAVVMTIADLLALSRTVPDKDTAQDPELATRLIQQLLNLGLAHAIADARSQWNESDTNLIRRVFADSLSAVRCRLLTYLYEQGKFQPACAVETLANRCMTSKKEMEGIVSQYRHSGILIPEVQEATQTTWYKLSPDVYDSLKEVQVFK